MPKRAARRITAAWPTAFPWKAPSIVTLLLMGLFLTTLFIESPRAEVRTVTVQGEHRMGDRDTREDAIRLATEASKRNALEQVATYLESVTVVTDLDVTKDEIRTYTAGAVLVLDQQVSTSLDGDTVVIHVDLTAQVDTDEVVQAIAALRQNEDARQELVALKTEVDQLHQELEGANQALSAAGMPEQVKEISDQRQEILNRVQSNAIVSQAWTDWVLVGPAVNPYPLFGLAQVQALLGAAGRLNPSNPHVQVAQQVITTQPAPAPPRPPSPPATSNLAPPVAHVPAPLPGPQPSRRLTSITQLNPFLMVPPGTPSSSVPPVVQQSQLPQGRQSSSSRRLSRMYQQTPSATQSQPSTLNSSAPANPQAPPPVTQSHSPRSPRHLSPRFNQFPQSVPHLAPQRPSRIGPPASRGSSHGGGHGRGGGGRGGMGGK